MTKGIRPLAAAVAVAAAAGMAGSAQAANGVDTTALQKAVEVGNKASNTGIRRHLQAAAADRRPAGQQRQPRHRDAGPRDSVTYVEQQLSHDGGYWKVYRAAVLGVGLRRARSADADVRTPRPRRAWVANTDFATMDASGSGAVPAGTPIAVIDFTAPTTTASASSAGCEAADFPASLAGKVAVIQRGTCDFGLKAKNAQDRGALGVIIFNEGTIGDPDRNGPDQRHRRRLRGHDPDARGDLRRRPLPGRPPGRDASRCRPHDTTNDVLETRNVIAETTTGRTDRTVISGAHLDSVPEGPGINDDGSGTATQIELALQMAKLNVKPANQVRFIWFSGEEQGLFGSTYYADQLTKTQRANTAAMLDFDMLASPNFAYQIYDGDGSEFGVSGPNGSGIDRERLPEVLRRARHLHGADRRSTAARTTTSSPRSASRPAASPPAPRCTRPRSSSPSGAASSPTASRASSTRATTSPATRSRSTGTRTTSTTRRSR